MNDYEKAREVRIKENKARLAELQVCRQTTCCLVKLQAAKRGHGHTALSFTNEVGFPSCAFQESSVTPAIFG